MFKEVFKPKKLVVFDLNGALLNTPPLWEAAFYTVLGDVIEIENSPYDLNKEIYYKPGLEIRDYWDEIINTWGLYKVKSKDLEDQTINTFFKLLEFYDLQVLGGFFQFVTELEQLDIKIAVASNLDKKNAWKLLNKAGIETGFDFEAFRDEVKMPKPEPDIYKKLIKDANVKTYQTLIFEDTYPGALAAHKAGIDVGIVDYEVHLRTEYPDNVIGYINDYQQFIGNLTTTALDRHKMWVEAYDSGKLFAYEPEYGEEGEGEIFQDNHKSTQK